MKKPVRLPDSELKIMISIWELGEKATTGKILELQEKGKTVQLVQSYLKRLEEKDFIKVEKVGRLNYYTPQITLEEYRTQETANFVDIFYKDNPSSLFVALLKEHEISADELLEIQKLIEENGGKK